MAEDIIHPRKGVGKPTYIYGLVDPSTHQLRYVGKSVLSPARRLSVHKWRAVREGKKRHSMAWIASLLAAGCEPEAFTIEVVPENEDWVEREQFWIAYFRSLGCNLCNHTIGGEGQTGYKQPAEMVEKRVKRGADHHRYGKGMPPKIYSAIMAGLEKFRSSHENVEYARLRQKQSLTPEMLKAGSERLAAILDDPVRHAARAAKVAAAARTPMRRAAVRDQSKSLWHQNREKIIAAQNAGKGDEWKAKQSALGRARMSDMNNPLRIRAKASRKVSVSDVCKIKEMVCGGAMQKSVAAAFRIDPSMVSRIMAGQRRNSQE